MERCYSSGWHRSGLALTAFALSAGVFASTASVPATAAPAGDTDQAPAFGRYTSILSRMPFGVPPPSAPTNPLPGAAASAATADPGKNFVLSEIVRTPAGDLVVGFTDNNPKPPRSLLLAVGEDLDGYAVVTADIDSETATLEKDGVRFELRMSSAAHPAAAVAPGGTPPAASLGSFARPMVPSGGSASSVNMAEFASRMGSRNPEAVPARLPAALPVSQAAPNSVGGVDRLPGAGVQDNSYGARMRDRREQLAKQAAEEQHRREQEVQARAQNVSTAEIDKRLHETNLNLMRKGLKPIGTIELTPEEDAELVSKGVLPAQ